MDDVNFAKRIEQHEALEQKIDEITKEFKTKLEPYLKGRAIVRAALLKMLDDTGQTSAPTAYGTATKVVRTTASVEDLELFRDHVIATGDWDALDWKCNSTVARERVEQTGALPPGVKLNQSVDVSVSTARAKARKPTVRPTKSNPFPEEQEAQAHG